MGLLNNIAEVPSLRTKLMLPAFLYMLRLLLCSEHIDVSYFAAGIVAHLTSEANLWKNTEMDNFREILLFELGKAVCLFIYLFLIKNIPKT